MLETAYLKSYPAILAEDRPPNLSTEAISIFYQRRWNCIIVEYAARSVFNRLPGKGCHFGGGPEVWKLGWGRVVVLGGSHTYRPFWSKPHRAEQRPCGFLQRARRSSPRAGRRGREREPGGAPKPEAAARD